MVNTLESLFYKRLVFRIHLISLCQIVISPFVNFFQKSFAAEASSYAKDLIKVTKSLDPLAVCQCDLKGFHVGMSIRPEFALRGS